MLNRPCKVMRVSSFRGYRIHPLTGKKTWHDGLDLATYGTLWNIFNCSAKVVDNRYNSARGNLIIIQASKKINGYFVRALYQHLACKSPLSIGHAVANGGIVGTAGNTGKSKGVHLHLEISISKDGKNWRVVNPMPYLLLIGSEDIRHVLTIEDDEKRDGYVLEVLRLQENLKKMGIYNGICDGIFGGNTIRGVKAFQSKYGLNADGSFGPGSLKKMQSLGYR